MADDKNTIEPIHADFDAVARSMVDVPDPENPMSATHRGILPIGGLQLECYVLEDGRRVFAKRGMARAIGLKSEGGNAFLKTLSGKKVGSEISEDLQKNLENPIVFNIAGADPGHGYEAETLVEVCKAVVRADDKGKLLDSQKPMANQARAIINALAKVGIAALIDEATGYQTERSPDALRLLVQAYIEDEQREWEKEFPDDFYLSLNKVYGSDPYIARQGGALVINKPQHFGNFTNKYVYGPLEKGEVLKELQRLNPKVDAKGTRKEKLHQFLSKGYGLEKLREQRQEVLTMLKLSDDIDEFKRLYEKRFGPMDDQWSFFFPDEERAK
uniref:P63C domain-containing protein n=1 Tax=uncultured Erythrobacter sp. TaxID=263913 RepID=UPI002623CCE8|nr:P63C domain-containing protein [uncultured Erythrobacter sp.]